MEGLCRLLIRLVRFTASIWYLAIFDALSQAWECDWLSKQPDRDAMEFVLAQTRRRARLFLFYLVLDTCSAAFFVLATQFRSGTLSSFSHSSIQVSFGFCPSCFVDHRRRSDRRVAVRIAEPIVRVNSTGSRLEMTRIISLSPSLSLPLFGNYSTAVRNVRTHATCFPSTNVLRSKRSLSVCFVFSIEL